MLAVPEHGHAVSQAFDLRHAVTDVNDADTLFAQPDDEREESLRFTLGQRRSRLIHHDHAVVVTKRASDLHHLLLCDAEFSDECVGRNPVIQRGEEPRRLLAHAGAVHPPEDAVSRFRTEQHVLRDGQRGNQRDFLVDERDPGAKDFGGTARDQRAPGQQNRAVARWKDTPEDLHQRALACTVLAHEGVDFAGAHREVDATQNRDAAETLGNPAHLEHGIRILAAADHFAVQPR